MQRHRSSTPLVPNFFLQSCLSNRLPFPLPTVLLLLHCIPRSHVNRSLSPTRETVVSFSRVVPQLDESLLEHTLARIFRIRKRQDSPTWLAPWKVYLSVVFNRVSLFESLAKRLSLSLSLSARVSSQAGKTGLFVRWIKVTSLVSYLLPTISIRMKLFRRNEVEACCEFAGFGGLMDRLLEFIPFRAGIYPGCASNCRFSKQVVKYDLNSQLFAESGVNLGIRINNSRPKLTLQINLTCRIFWRLTMIQLLSDIWTITFYWRESFENRNNANR